MSNEIRERLAAAMLSAWQRAEEDSSAAHLDRYAMADALLPIVHGLIGAAYQRGFEEAKELAAQEADWVTDLKGGSNEAAGMRIAKAIRALERKPCA